MSCPSKTAGNSPDIPSNRSSRDASIFFGTATAFALLGSLIAYIASSEAGFLFGWIVGSSLSPISSVAANVIISMITGSVFLCAIRAAKVASWPTDPDSALSLITAALLFALVGMCTVSFIRHAWDGIRDGTEVRIQYLKSDAGKRHLRVNEKATSGEKASESHQ